MSLKSKYDFPLTSDEISKRTNVNRTTVTNWAKKNGVPLGINENGKASYEWNDDSYERWLNRDTARGRRWK